MYRPPPSSPLFPYTTLFRSLRDLVVDAERAVVDARQSLRAAGHRVPERMTASIAHPGPDPRFIEWASVPLVVDGHDMLLRSEEHTSELQSHVNLVCRLLLEK